MHPNTISSWISDYLTKMQHQKEASAQKYIEDNIDLLETNMEEFDVPWQVSLRYNVNLVTVHTYMMQVR